MIIVVVNVADSAKNKKKKLLVFFSTIVVRLCICEKCRLPRFLLLHGLSENGIRRSVHTEFDHAIGRENVTQFF